MKKKNDNITLHETIKDTLMANIKCDIPIRKDI